MNLENKNKIQTEAIQHWIANDYNGTVVVGTGVGKTRIGLMAIKDAYERHLRIPESEVYFSALIIVPTTNLRDNEWVNEIDKWFPELKEFITIECIQTAYKEIYDMNIIVVDEIHTTLSPEYRKFYEYNYGYSKLIGLTATVPHIEEYATYLTKICPIIYTLTTQQAVELGLISEYEVVNIQVGFNRKEAAKYRTYTSMFLKAMGALSNAGNAFEVANRYKKEKSHPLYKMASQFWTGMSMRRWVCYKAESKLQACVDIIQNTPRNKWIVFCQHTDFADKLADELRDKGIMAVSYHSKQKAKDREQILENAKSPLCKVICSAQALNTGYNLPDIDAAICAAGTGTELTFVQSRGRILRLGNNIKRALFINLYVRDTQEYTWVKNKLDDEAKDYASVAHFLKSNK